MQTGIILRIYPELFKRENFLGREIVAKEFNGDRYSPLLGMFMHSIDKIKTVLPDHVLAPDRTIHHLDDSLGSLAVVPRAGIVLPESKEPDGTFEAYAVNRFNACRQKIPH